STFDASDDSPYGGYVGQVVAFGQRVAYVNGMGDGVVIADTSDAKTPAYVRTVPVDGYIRQLHGHGDLAIVSSGYDGVQLIDVADGRPGGGDAPPRDSPQAARPRSRRRRRARPVRAIALSSSASGAEVPRAGARCAQMPPPSTTRPSSASGVPPATPEPPLPTVPPLPPEPPVA